MSTSTMDYYNEILVDHNNVRDLYKRFVAAHQSKDEKSMNDIANTIVHEAALHSDGEELSIYKVLDAHGLHDAAEKDREEHQQVKQAMSHVDSNSVSSLGIDEFAKAVDKAYQLFNQHAEDEENNQYKLLPPNYPRKRKHPWRRTSSKRVRWRPVDRTPLPLNMVGSARNSWVLWLSPSMLPLLPAGASLT
ncbi:hemerythrin HHE cation-binding domain protein [Rhizoctonia solani AG-3 Rhs1AP]|uniref:Hemerythrin HHE cation-binding domain protein n=1 Tax=Rhizoctonia solani AG-3 Rhs1AP TaxID=1086054 RepID=X8J134_9AGAM|nr:hemerythrin HHE cation-binding domain protein [Rhizoctonia solani AG-3 Rhs1AP]